MAHRERVLENPVSGERITFRETAADTRGELLAFDLDLTPDGQVPAKHVHPIQEERFEVVYGTMRFWKRRRTDVAGAGEVVVVPPGTPHKFENAGDEPAHVRVEVRPALRMERLFETAIGLAREGRTNRRGLPKPLDLALFAREFEHEVRAPFPPRGVLPGSSPAAWVAA